MNYVHSKSDERPFSCQECTFECKRKGNLVDHVKHVHSEERPFSSPECNSTFKRRAYVARHIREVHSFDFKSKSFLARHLKKIHSNNIPFKCAECFYNCKSKSDLTRHVRSVHESNPISALKIVNVFSVAPEDLYKVDSADMCIWKRSCIILYHLFLNELNTLLVIPYCPLPGLPK